MNKQARTSFKTEKGTELPLLNLKGKEYLQVAQRLVWFLEEKTDWSIETEFSIETSDAAKAKATIRDERGRIRSTGHKLETATGFPDFHEKAETGAVGRALALVGYGTQFTGDDFDEGERLADAPISPASPEGPKKQIDMTPKAANPFTPPEKKTVFKTPQLHSASEPEWHDRRRAITGFDPGEYVMPFGKDYKGKSLNQCDPVAVRGFAKWMFNQATSEKKPLTGKSLDAYCYIMAYAEQATKDGPPAFSKDEPLF